MAARNAQLRERDAASPESRRRQEASKHLKQVLVKVPALESAARAKEAAVRLFGQDVHPSGASAALLRAAAPLAAPPAEPAAHTPCCVALAAQPRPRGRRAVAARALLSRCTAVFDPRHWDAARLHPPGSGQAAEEQGAWLRLHCCGLNSCLFGAGRLRVHANDAHKRTRAHPHTHCWSK
jgi:hypothetical protein